ncbi:unnamed protein product [Paramecium sonneborni]|uniref:Uncharacterized protein n=1 Tax=Paramecium sonneborni TaxID=65129 RepID=A0A8S1RJL4_9CILI|nr:unnamed protein product [Paramecium sonneborni]
MQTQSKQGSIYHCLSPQNIKRAVNKIQCREQQSNPCVRFNNQDNRLKQFQTLLNSYMQSKSPSITKTIQSRKSLNEPSINNIARISVTPQKSEFSITRKQNTEHKEFLLCQSISSQTSDFGPSNQFKLQLQQIQQKVRERFKRYEEEKKIFYEEKKLFLEEKKQLISRIQQLELQVQEYTKKKEALDQSFG